jgi:hypothetical protein
MGVLGQACCCLLVGGELLREANLLSRRFFDKIGAIVRMLLPLDRSSRALLNCRFQAMEEHSMNVLYRDSIGCFNGEIDMRMTGCHPYRYVIFMEIT